MAAADLRLRGAPLAYAVGRASFRHLTLEVDQRVLIPRPETEQLVEIVLEETAATPGGVAIDVGTGSGAIALALGAEGRFSRVYGTDVSRDALAVARAERRRCVDRSCARRWNFCTARCSGRLPTFALVSSCRIRRTLRLGEAAALPASVRDWEPAVALFSGSDGLRGNGAAGARSRGRFSFPEACSPSRSTSVARRSPRRWSVASAAFTPFGWSWTSRDASASCSPDDRRRVDDRG